MQQTNLIIDLLGIAAGAYAIWLGVRKFAAFRRIRDWPSVTGRVVGHGDPVTKGRSSYFDIHYEYSVGGQTLQGSISSKAWTDGRRGKAIPAVGDEILVYYNPQKPDDSVAARDRYSHFIYIAIGVGAVAVFLVGLTIDFRR